MDGFSGALWAIGVAVLSAPFAIILRVPQKAIVVIRTWGLGAFIIAATYALLALGYDGGVSTQYEDALRQLKDSAIDIELVRIETPEKDWGLFAMYAALAYGIILTFWNWLMNSDH
ncbi:hypothetical protein [Paracoccus haeundaensis]|uniref:Uncharacterized protein n=1 Tax=Paracoccus haeundaensis TaxID=225362 RepID=A0A5C4RBH1_9RHOB|nr:hypothetical protein [Paracoccus haeundaensis]TNH41268.1 hypothetical protein FHD67_00710 [Paracoccus haeundaensis]